MRLSNPLATLVQNSNDLKSINFATQRSDEELKLLLRKHVVSNSSWVFSVLISALIPILSLVFKEPLSQLLSLENLLDLFQPQEWIFLASVYYLAIFYFGFLKFLGWYFNVLIVTNRRIIDINYIPPFHRQTTQAQLEEIQDVQHEQGGIFAIIFNYGDLFIQTAGTRQNIFLRQVPQPNVVHNLIIQMLPYR